MAGSTEFLPFATGGSANVEDQATWAADAAVTNGFSSGIASSAKFNKALRQGTFFAAAISQWIADHLSTTVHDDGSVPTLEGQFESALASFVSPFVSQGSSPITAITTNGTGDITSPSWAGHLYVKGIAGAGGGGSGTSSFSGGGGGAGGWFEGIVAVTPSTSYAYVIGAGGAGGTAGGVGAAGGSTSLAGVGSATGGGGANSISPNPAGSAGGSGGTSTAIASGINTFTGSYGKDGNVTSNTVGGAGGDGPFGGGGRSGSGGGLSGVNAGSGGGGASNGVGSGGAGHDGALYYQWRP